MNQLIETVKVLITNDAITSDATQYLVLNHGQYDDTDAACMEDNNTVLLIPGDAGYATLEALSTLLDENLITEGGNPDYDAIGLLERTTGCKVVKGEGDSFGWLTGVLCTSKGMFVYG